MLLNVLLHHCGANQYYPKMDISIGSPTFKDAGEPAVFFSLEELNPRAGLTRLMSLTWKVRFIKKV